MKSLSLCIKVQKINIYFASPSRDGILWFSLLVEGVDNLFLENCEVSSYCSCVYWTT